MFYNAFYRLKTPFFFVNPQNKLELCDVIKCEGCGEKIWIATKKRGGDRTPKERCPFCGGKLKKMVVVKKCEVGRG